MPRILHCPTRISQALPRKLKDCGPNLPWSSSRTVAAERLEGEGEARMREEAETEAVKETGPTSVGTGEASEAGEDPIGVFPLAKDFRKTSVARIHSSYLWFVQPKDYCFFYLFFLLSDTDTFLSCFFISVGVLFSFLSSEMWIIRTIAWFIRISLWKLQ